MEPSELTTVSILLLRFTRVFSYKSLAISDLGCPSGEVPCSLRRLSLSIWSVSLEGFGGIVDTVIVKPVPHV